MALATTLQEAQDLYREACANIGSGPVFTFPLSRGEVEVYHRYEFSVKRFESGQPVAFDVWPKRVTLVAHETGRHLDSLAEFDGHLTEVEVLSRFFMGAAA